MYTDDFRCHFELKKYTLCAQNYGTNISYATCNYEMANVYIETSINSFTWSLVKEVKKEISLGKTSFPVMAVSSSITPSFAWWIYSSTCVESKYKSVYTLYQNIGNK